MAKKLTCPRPHLRDRRQAAIVRLAEPICRVISHCDVRTQVSSRIVKPDFFEILVDVIGIGLIIAAAAVVYLVFLVN